MTTRITMKIGGMSCPNCAMVLEQMEDRLNGVKQVEASYHKGQMTVVYDETVITKEQIKTEVNRLGYEVVVETSRE